MKNLFKCSIGTSALVALAGSVYANPTLVVEDGNPAFNMIQSSASGVVTISTSDNNWSVVVATGTSTPPIPGGNPSTPTEDLLISAIYTGSHNSGNPLIISFANDGFGPTTGSLFGELTGQAVSGGFANLGWTDYDGAGSHLPTIANPIPPGLNTTSTSLSGPVYFGTLTSPISLGSPYTLGEEISLTGTYGSVYNIDVSIETRTSVPDGGMTLIFLGSALSALAALKKKL